MPHRGSIVIHVPDIVYVFVNGQDYTANSIEYSAKKELNQAGTFRAKFLAISDSERTHFSEGKEVKFIAGPKCFMRGKIASTTYSTTYEIEVEGNGWGESILKERMVEDTIPPADAESEAGRPFYNDVLVRTIVQQQLSGTGIALDITNNGNDLGYATCRGEMINRMSFIAQLIEQNNGEWWFDYGSPPKFNTCTLNIGRQKGSSTSTYSYDITGANTNALNTDHESDFGSLTNVITGLGMGDGQNQLKSKMYHATTNRTTLVGDLPKEGTIISGVAFGAFPDTGAVWIGEELINYNAKTATQLSDCTKWVSGTATVEGSFRLNYDPANSIYSEVPADKKYIHKSGIAIYDAQYTIDSPQAGSSIQLYGIKEDTSIDRSMSDQDALDFATQLILTDRYQLIERNTVTPAVFSDTLGNVDVGDTVSITDAESNLSGDTRIKTLTLKNDNGWITTEVETSNAGLELMRELAGATAETGILGKYMQGSTNSTQFSIAENCDVDYPLNIRFYLPEDVIAVNKALLNLKVSEFRGYARALGHSHVIPGLSIATSTTPSSDVAEYLNLGNNFNPEGVTFGASGDSVFSTIPSSLSGSYDGCVVTVWIRNQSSANDTYSYNLAKGATTLASWSNVTINNNNWRTEQVNVPSTSASAGDTLTFTVTDGVTGTEVGETYIGGIGIFIQTATTHAHSLTGVTTSASTSATAVGLNYGIYTSGVASKTLDIVIGKEGSEATFISGVAASANPSLSYDVSKEIQSVGPGNWANIRVISDNPARLEGNLYLKYFVQSR